MSYDTYINLKNNIFQQKKGIVNPNRWGWELWPNIFAYEIKKHHNSLIKIFGMFLMKAK